jgi:hypothetical protein
VKGNNWIYWRLVHGYYARKVPVTADTCTGMGDIKENQIPLKQRILSSSIVGAGESMPYSLQINVPSTACLRYKF